jgi:hypothetical protein
MAVPSPVHIVGGRSSGRWNYFGGGVRLNPLIGRDETGEQLDARNVDAGERRQHGRQQAGGN